MVLGTDLFVLHSFLSIPAFYKSLISLTEVVSSVSKTDNNNNCIISTYSFKKHLRLKLLVDSHFHNLTVAVMNYALAQETKSCKNGWVLLIKIIQQIFEYLVYVKLCSKPSEYIREQNKTKTPVLVI